MDRAVEAQAKERWSWLPVAMPGVAQLMAERRAEFGQAHVLQCWQRGMLKREPGWFFAREGAVAIGTPWLEQQDALLAALTRWDATSTQVLLILRKPGVAYGAHP